MNTWQRSAFRIIRETLEGKLSTKLTSKVLFEALEKTQGNPPHSREDLSAWVDGALKATIRQSVDEAQAKDVFEALDERLNALLSGDGVQPEGDTSPRAILAEVTRRDRDATVAIPTGGEPVRVAVVASGMGFAGRLDAALGPKRVDVDALHTAEGLKDKAPAIALVDATDFPPIEPETLAKSLDGLTNTSARVVWGADLPYGARVVSAMTGPCVALPISEGIEPLIDLIRSRRRG